MALFHTLGVDNWDYGNERVVSYLPLSHIAGTVRILIIKVNSTTDIAIVDS